MTQAIALDLAIQILHNTSSRLMANRALFVMVLHAQQYLEAQMTAELHA